MIVLVATGAGFGLGLAYFGALWLSVRRLHPGRVRAFATSRAARLGFALVTFYTLLTNGGPIAIAAGLGGMSLARCYALRSWGGAVDGR